MKKTNPFRSSAKLVFGIGLTVCALACAVYGILMHPTVKGIAFQWQFFALIGFVAVLVSLVSLILLGIAKSEENGETPEENDEENDEEAGEGESVEEVTLILPKSSTAGRTVRPRVPVKSIDCTAGEKKRRIPIKKMACNKDLLIKVGLVAIPTVAVGLVAWSVSTNVKHAKKAKRRQQFYRWLG